jgi:predicted Zn-dependent protease
MNLIRIFFALAIVCLVSKSSANFQIVRDAEIEETLTEMVKPIFKVAGLRPESAKIYIVNSKVINAFTIGNGYIFITSGLLLQFTNPLHLIGILCHETGHISAGHINRHISLLQQRSTNFMAAVLAGLIGVTITGSPDALAILLGYAITDERFYLKFSRGEEFAADSLAISYLEKLGYGSDVLIDAFQVFLRMEILNGGTNLPVYIMTHPKTNDRITNLQKHVKRKTYRAEEHVSKKYERAITKLKAYLKDYDLSSAISDDDYSRAIYFHRSGRSGEAITILRNLLKANPADTYYKEALAQILYESGKLEESIAIYEQIFSNDINTLIKIDYANVLIEAGKKIDKAISILEAAKYATHLNSDVFRLLAKGYGKKGREGLASFMLAQEQIFLQNYKKAYELLIVSLSKLNQKTENSQLKKAKYYKELLERDYKELIR